MSYQITCNFFKVLQYEQHKYLQINPQTHKHIPTNRINDFLGNKTAKCKRTQIRESGRRLWRLQHWIHHHTPCPRHRCDTPQDDLLVDLDRQPVLPNQLYTQTHDTTWLVLTDWCLVAPQSSCFHPVLSWGDVSIFLLLQLKPAYSGSAVHENITFSDWLL